MTDRAPDGSLRCQSCGFVRKYWYPTERHFTAILHHASKQVMTTCGYYECMDRAVATMDAKPERCPGDGQR